MLTTFFFKKGEPLKTNLTRAEMLAAYTRKEGFLWVDLEAPTEFEEECLIEIFNFHDLAIDDCLNDLSQPKVDDYEEYLFMVMHAIALEEEALKTTELDIFIGPHYVVTFAKEKIKSMDRIRESVQKRTDSYMGRGADTFTYFVLDYLVDSYQPVIDHYEDKIDKLEDEIFNHSEKDYLAAIMQAKRDIFHFRRVVAPQRDTLNYITRNPSEIIKPENIIYFRDVYDHLYRIYGAIDGFHEALTGILQAYFSHSSNKLNLIMKRMTVLATLTMPAVMISSIYGMNFRSMPELEHPYGYFFALALMGLISGIMLVWIKWKKWI